MGFLVPCPSCRRHLRRSEMHCPFCQAAVPDGLRGASSVEAPRGLSRAAALLFGASLAVGGCGSGAQQAPDASPTASPDPAQPDPGGPVDDPGAMAAEYGAPAPPLEPEPEMDEPAPEEVDDGGMAPKYGAPPPPER